MHTQLNGVGFRNNRLNMATFVDIFAIKPKRIQLQCSTTVAFTSSSSFYSIMVPVALLKGNQFVNQQVSTCIQECPSKEIGAPPLAKS